MPRLLPLLLTLLALPVLPAALAGSGGGPWFEDDVATQAALGHAVAKWTHKELDAASYNTGVELYDGEWLFGTYTMAAMGFGQLAMAHPEAQGAWLEEMDHSLTEATKFQVRVFDAQRWGEDPLDQNAKGDHLAYLGYLALPFALRERVGRSQGREAAWVGELMSKLERRFQAKDQGLLESYPGEGYPVDNCMGLGALGLYADATGRPKPAWLVGWVDRLLSEQVDPKTGLLIQHAEPTTGLARSPARGSGTALCAYALSFAFPEEARALAEATRDKLDDTFLGFGVVREYAPGVPGDGDIDSGPLILGYGVSTTGFSMSSARLLNDEAWFSRLYATAHLFGAHDGAQFVTGGPLGNAILLAMMTTPKGAE